MPASDTPAEPRSLTTTSTMLHRLRHLRACLVILLLLATALGLGERATLCLLPDGGMHLEGDTSCPSAAGHWDSVPTAGQAGDRLEHRQPCIDVALGGELADHHSRASSPIVPPTLVPLGTPIPPFQLVCRSSRHLPPVSPLSPQRISLQSTVLLI